MFLALCGLRNRLLSFAEIDDMARHQHRFWVRERGVAMRLFLAGNVKGADSDRTDHAAGVENRLLTFADIDGWAAESFAFWVGENPARAKVFLDSGAFGAFTRGAVIDIGRYCDYIHEHAAALDCYAALDVIGDWRATARNLAGMEARGLKPIPCFHRGEPWEVLDEMAASHPHIALGGMVGGEGERGTTSPDSLMPYLDRAWDRIGRHWPVKVHVFGIVAQWVVERYPFYSADSASAIMGAGMGRVMRFGDGRMRSIGWTDYARLFADGVVADGIGRVDGSAHAGRRRRNIEAQLAMERYVTDTWTQRGVVWG